MVKCLPEFEYFTVFLKNRNSYFISKIKRSKITDYGALTKTSISLLNGPLICRAYVGYCQFIVIANIRTAYYQEVADSNRQCDGVLGMSFYRH